MNVMTLLMERIDDELQDACDYAKLALEYRVTEPELAVLFARLSEEEMTHMQLLHGAAVEQIERIRRLLRLWLHALKRWAITEIAIFCKLLLLAAQQKRGVLWTS